MNKINFVFIILLFLLVSNIQATEQLIERIDVMRSLELINKNLSNENFIIIDIRTKNEFEQGHIEGAVLIDYYDKEFKTNLDKLDKNKLYFIYCRSGNRSGRSLALFKELGFITVYELKNGFRAWVKQNNKVVY